jgi:hypothetical protein
MNKKLVLSYIGWLVVINLVLPFVVKLFATPEQIKPPNGASNLSFFDQLMHMFVHRAVTISTIFK